MLCIDFKSRITINLPNFFKRNDKSISSGPKKNSSSPNPDSLSAPDLYIEQHPHIESVSIMPL